MKGLAEIKGATVTATNGVRVYVRFAEDEVASALAYPKLKSYAPVVGDRVLMLRTSTSYVVLGAIG